MVLNFKDLLLGYRETYSIDFPEGRHQSDGQLDCGALPARPWHGGNAAQGEGGPLRYLRAEVSSERASRRGT